MSTGYGRRFNRVQCTAAVWFLCQTFAAAQLPVAELDSLYPPIIEAGKTSEVTGSGTWLDDLSALVFSSPEVKGDPIWLSETEYRKSPRQDGLRFSVTVPADFPSQVIEARTAGYYGLSTSCPLTIVPSGTRLIADGGGAAHHQIDSAPELPREAYAYGTLDSKQIDWWKFTVKKDQRVVIHCRAGQILSQADATLLLTDARGVELQRDRDTVGRDPLIDFTAPKAGAYWIGVHDFFFNGGVNYPYILQITSRPWIDAVFPPAGRAGETFEATLLGRNLPGGSSGESLFIGDKPIETLRVKIALPKERPGPRYGWESPAQAMLSTFPFALANSNTVPVGFSNQTVTVLENDADPQALSPPCEAAARFDFPGDIDSFRFAAKKGAVYWIEAIGHRLSGKCDPFLAVEKITKNSDGTEKFQTVREGDDQSASGGTVFPNGSRDLSLSFTADQDGEYRVTVVNQFGSGGPDQIYRLVIREADPDFAAIAVAERPFTEQRQAYPAVPLLRKGGTFPLRILLDRHDGFGQEITVQAENLPPGVTCPPVTIPSKENGVRLILCAAPDAALWRGFIDLKASAKLGENQVLTRSVRLGSLVRGAPDYSRSRLQSRLELGVPLAVSEHESAPAAIELKTPRQLSVEIGGKLEIAFSVVSNSPRKGNLAVTVSGLRGLRKPPVVNIAEKAKEGKVVLDFSPKNGVFLPEEGTWNFLLKGTGITRYQSNPQALRRAEEENTLAESLEKKYAEEAAKCKAELAKARRAVEAAEKTNQNAAIANAKTLLAQAEKRAAAAEAERATAEKEKTAAAQRLAQAKKASALRDVKVAAWSAPLVVEVKNKPKKSK